MRIILLGPPGAGKGTQCKRIVDKYNVVHLSSGDILRAERAAGTDLGKKAQSYMDSGGLVPDDLIVAMMAGAIKKAGHGFVLDGFPRTVNQAQELDKALAAAGLKIEALLNLQIDDAVVASRMTGRRSCPKCGTVYHIENLKPKTAGKCDKDGSELVQRPDDTSEVVANRLKTYHAQTAPVIGYYQKQNLVVDLDAGKDIDEVTRTVFAKLDAISKV
jgi:adenylate kinase